MAGKIVEKNAIEENEDKRKCTKGCSKRFCSCFRFNDRCNPSYRCGLSCQNMFYYLEYFFGEN